MSVQQLCVKWNNHQNNMLGIFNELLDNDHFVDVTIACDGKNVKAHRLVLSACSPFFKELLTNNPCPHPIIILNNIDFTDLKILLDFMYKGQVNVRKDKLQNVLKAAETLRVTGLGEIAKTNKEFNSTEKPTPPTKSNTPSSSSATRKQSDHHYSCSSPKTPTSKRRKVAPAVSELKVPEASAGTNGEDTNDVPNEPAENEAEAHAAQAAENDDVINEQPALSPSVGEQDTANQDLEDSNAQDEGDAPSESCVITMPIVEADGESISELEMSELEGRQFAQITDGSGNTVLVLIPESSTTELAHNATDDVPNSEEASKKTTRKKRSREPKSDEPDYTELHFKRDDGSTMKLYQCLHCDSRFANPGNVRRHTFSAHKGYRIECEVCHTLFTQKSSKDFHFRTVHAGIRYNCDECGCQFTEKRTLLNHISNVHSKGNSNE